MATTTASYKDTHLPIEARVDALMGEMTLEEKIAQMGSNWVYELLQDGNFSPEKGGKLLKNGVGHITRVGGASNVTPQQSADLANAIQKYLIENTRLGIPAVV